ncbi:hypothetical protein GCM10007301_15810 [Azorhizobium oxalatiphilum]|uniref:Uncharacterized protein n=1 Tax=Azorhizobium oxalatiphilum TaxID=980631 RepID=A0A917BTK6_9HYPH|nr:hypothetical protein [Azorhizobium oxalatiphilum]GGF56943.1 hypothetical protein GCM10007301_15810 [Azorhizobium oxalatiphilum]
MPQRTRQDIGEQHQLGGGMEGLLYLLFGMALIGLFVLGTLPRS